jgi:ABC-type phosphate transport system substrate-binding protein
VSAFSLAEEVSCMKSLYLATVLIAAMASGARADSPGFKVVVNPANPVLTLTREEVARIFLKKITAWPDGGSVTAVDQPRTSATRAAFSTVIIGKPADAVAAYWQTLVSSGRVTPPVVRHSDDDVLEFVRKTPGAVGYVAADVSLAGVRVLSIR